MTNKLATSNIAELVTFHVRYIRYHHPGKSEDFDSLDEAISFALNHFDYGESCRQEIWCGDELIYELDQILKMRREDDY